MNRTKIAQLYADAESLGGQTVTVAGWVKSVRDMKNFGFVTLNDGSCFRDLQVVMNREALDNYDEIAHQNVSAALICTGTVKLTPDAPQPFELSATSIEVEGTSAPDYPLQKKRATVEFLRTQQHLRPRTNLFRAVFRIRSVAAAAIHRFFQEQGFVYVNTPIITTSDCEGAGEMFRVTTLDPKNPPLTESGEVVEIITASVRTPNHVTQAALLGADIATVPMAALKKCLHHPLTDQGLASFEADWKKVVEAQ